MDKIDIVIIGAGIAGITSAYYLQKNFPNIKFKIIESRNDLGGTWDQMRFPGVRADNDMYTYGFSFDPWKGPIIGSGEDIKKYLEQVTNKSGFKKNILFNTEVKSLHGWLSRAEVPDLPQLVIQPPPQEIVPQPQALDPQQNDQNNMMMLDPKTGNYIPPDLMM